MPEIFGAALMGGGSGPAFAAIGAIYPAGATCTCSYGGKTITAKDTSGRALFLVPSAGQWLVKASNGGQDVEDTVSITTQGQVASVTLAFFSATIQATFPADCTSVTCTKDSTVLSVPSGSLSSGVYTFDIPEPGDWALYATNGIKDKTITVNVTEEIAYTAALTFELVLFDNGEYAEETGGWGGSKGGIKSKQLYIECNSGSDYESGPGWFYTNLKVNLVGYNTLHFTVKSTSNTTGDCAVGIGSNQTSISSRVNVTKGLSSEKTFDLDVSQSNNAFYIIGHRVGYTSLATMYVSKVWLE